MLKVSFMFYPGKQNMEDCMMSLIIAFKKNCLEKKSNKSMAFLFLFLFLQFKLNSYQKERHGTLFSIYLIGFFFHFSIQYFNVYIICKMIRKLFCFLKRLWIKKFCDITLGLCKPFFFQMALESEHLHRIYLTRILKDFECDTFLPLFDPKKFQIVT